MRLVEWVRRWNAVHGREGRGGKTGALTELMRRSGCSYATVWKAGSKGEPITYEVAERLSEATGGEVSIDELRFPERFADAPTDDHAPAGCQGAAE